MSVRARAIPSKTKTRSRLLETFPPMAEIVNKLPADTAVELWFHDQMRLGQKNGLVYQ